MSEYAVESRLFMSREEENEMVRVMKANGTITGTAGGFPLSPMTFFWKCKKKALKEIEKFNVKVVKYRA